MRYIGKIHWGMRDILREKKERESRDESKQLIADARASYSPTLQKPRFTVIKREGKGYHATGIGHIAAPNGIDSVRAAARTAGFTHIRHGIVKTKI